jgi:RNA polymerase sigma factor (sigma-70 family)
MLANRLYNHWQDRATACGVTQDDCCQVCWFAFLDAVEAYNKEPDRKEKFTSFIGFHVKRQIYVLLGLRTSKKEPLNSAVSLDAPSSDDAEYDSTVADTVSDPEAERPYEEVEQSDLSDRVLERLSLLPLEQREVIRRRFWYEESFTDIATALGLTVLQVRALYIKATRKLYHDFQLQRSHREFYDNTNFTRNVGLRFFKETGSSSVEWSLIRLEELLERVRGGGYGKAN